jgi:hypothetical protein
VLLRAFIICGDDFKLSFLFLLYRKLRLLSVRIDFPNLGTPFLQIIFLCVDLLR